MRAAVVALLALALTLCVIHTTDAVYSCVRSASTPEQLNEAFIECEHSVYVTIMLTGVSYDGAIVITNATHVVLNGTATQPIFTNTVIKVQGNETALYYFDLNFDGASTVKALHEPPLRSNNLTIVRCNFHYFHGPFLVQGEACDENVHVMVTQSTFFDVWGSALWFAGLNGYFLGNNSFPRCGGKQNSCVFMKRRWGATGDIIAYDNIQYALWDEQPPPCTSYIDPFQHVRCGDGQEMMCEDISATMAADDCPGELVTAFDPLINATREEFVYDVYCRRYRECECEDVRFQDISNSTRPPFALAVGDLIYGTTRMKCVAGTELASSGSIGNTPTVTFSDSGFDTTTSSSPWTYSPSSARRQIGSEARSDSWAMMCDEAFDAAVSQSVTFPQNGNYLIGVWLRRRRADPEDYEYYPLRLLIDNQLVSTITGDSMMNLLQTAGVYVRVVFPIFAATAGTHTVKLSCQWRTINMIDSSPTDLLVYVEDIFSLSGGVEFIDFPPGMGTGPGVYYDALDSIALPLTSDATLDIPYTCPVCPAASTRPPDMPCQYTVDGDFSCYSLTKSSKTYCMTPANALPTNGAQFADQSFESASNAAWTGVPTSRFVDIDALNDGDVFPYAGNHALYVDSDLPLTFSQTVVVSNDGYYTVAMHVLAIQYGVITTSDDPTITLLVDGVVVGSYPMVAFVFDAYVTVYVGPAYVDAGTRTFSFLIEYNYAQYPYDLYIDDVQFVAAPTLPTPSASHAPLSEADAAYAVLLWCDGGTVKRGANAVVGCVLPADALLGTKVQNGITMHVPAAVCAFDSACSLPSSYSIVINDFTMACVAGLYMTCSCDSSTLEHTLLNHTLDDNTAGFEFDNIQYGTERVFIINNRAQQLDYGAIFRRTDCDTIRANSVALVDMFDEYCVGREVLKLNPYLWGRKQLSATSYENAPRVLMDALPVYEKVCEDGCGQVNPYVGDYAVTGANLCLVDNSGNSDDGSNIDAFTNRFTDLATALKTGRCRQSTSWIVVLESENFYEGDFVLDTDESVHLFTPDGATIVGTIRVTGGPDVVYIRGFTFVHGGSNGQGLIDIEEASGLKNFTVLNNFVDGVGIKNAPFIYNRNRVIAHVDVSYNTFANFLGTTFRISADYLRMVHNTFDSNSGRALQVRYRRTFYVEHNVFRETRGSGDIEKSVLVDIQYAGSSAGYECGKAPGTCVLRNNVQVIANADTAEDYKEVMYLLRGGRMFIDDIRDNAAVKARTGMRIRGVEFYQNDSSSALLDGRSVIAQLQLLNPLIRNSRTRLESKGEDFMIDGYIGGVRFGVTSCAFPECTDYVERPKRCIVNLNFDALHTERFGWEVHQNVSQAAFYCSLNLVEVTTWGGARIIPGAITLSRPYSDNLLFPLRDTTSVAQIIAGQRPVPSAFVIEGRHVTPADTALFVSLMDNPLRYGLGVPTLVRDRSDLYCDCYIALFGGTNEIANCSARYHIECANYNNGALYNHTLSNGTAVLLPVSTCTTSALACTALGYQIVRGGLPMSAYQCSWSTTLQLDSQSVLGSALTLTLSRSEAPVVDLRTCNYRVKHVEHYEYGVSATVNTCFPPAFYGIGSTVRALNITWRDVGFFMHYDDVNFNDEGEDDVISVAMLQSLENAADQLFQRVLFDGRNSEAPGPGAAVMLISGLDTNAPLGRKKIKSPPAVRSRVVFDDCEWRNFLFYESILGNNEGSDDDAAEVAQFPYMNGLSVVYMNTRAQDDTTFIMRNCRGALIDRRFIDVRFANTTVLENVSCSDCGGRSLDSNAAVYLEANKNSQNALVSVTGGNFTQRRAVTYPYLGDLAVPSFTSMIWITGLSDVAVDACTARNLTIDQCDAEGLTCCPRLVFSGNRVHGLPIGLRLVDVPEAAIRLGLPTGTVYEFDDPISVLRELARINELEVDGSFCDIIAGPPYGDWLRENLCCNELCQPPLPAACRVNSSDPYIQPSHPWYNTYWFDDINTARELCIARRRTLHIEAPSQVNRCYDTRLSGNAAQASVVQYRALFGGRFNYTIFGTSPLDTPSPVDKSVTVQFDDVDSVAAMTFELISGVLTATTESIEVTMNTVLPGGSAPGTEYRSPVDWLVDASILFTFALPPNTTLTLPLAPRIEFSLNYTRMSEALAAHDFSWIGYGEFEWSWTNASARLVSDNTFHMVGVGLPCIRCNDHSMNAYSLHMRDFVLEHADACDAASSSLLVPPLDTVTCPCTASSDGAATWKQRANDSSVGLHFDALEFDGVGSTALAVDGVFGDNVQFSRTSFADYAGDNLIRMDGESCATSNRVSFTKNLFVGSDTRMRGNIIHLRDVTGYELVENTFSDVSFRSVSAQPLSMFHAEPCSGVRTSVRSELNLVSTLEDTITTPINGCLYTAFYHGGKRHHDWIVRDETCKRHKTEGAAVCLRFELYTAVFPDKDCRSPLRTVAERNPFAQGVKFDVMQGSCENDACALARCTSTDTCRQCNDGCPGVTYPDWIGLVIAVPLAVFAFVLMLVCVGAVSNTSRFEAVEGFAKQPPPMDIAQYEHTNTQIASSAATRVRMERTGLADFVSAGIDESSIRRRTIINNNGNNK